MHSAFSLEFRELGVLYVFSNIYEFYRWSNTVPCPDSHPISGDVAYRIPGYIPRRGIPTRKRKLLILRANLQVINSFLDGIGCLSTDRSQCVSSSSFLLFRPQSWPFSQAAGGHLKTTITENGVPKVVPDYATVRVDSVVLIRRSLRP